MPKTNTKHIPVLLSETLHYLDPRPGQSYLDLTAGYGGHAEAVLERTKTPSQSILVDRDADAVEYLHQRFAGSGAQIINEDFLSAATELAGQGRQFDMVLVDLGLSSPHLDDASRGFSIQRSGPLDMRMDQSQDLTASEVVNHWQEKDLERILRQYGEEPKAQAIARKIAAARPIESTDQLAAIAGSVWPGRSKIHPATRTFQALRIAVNSELEQLETTLPLMLKLLAPEGRLVIISFHSLEDRMVKQFLKEHSGGYDGELNLLTKKPITASQTEIVSNPRARSAKLRASRKNKNK